MKNTNFSKSKLAHKGVDWVTNCMITEASKERVSRCCWHLRENKGRIREEVANESKMVQEDRDFLGEELERGIFSLRSLHVNQTGQVNNTWNM